MTILLVQIFVLLLGAFLLGATTACLFRRAFVGGSEEAIAAASAGFAAARTQQAPAPKGDAARFERALAGDPSAAVPPPFQSAKAPMVEVQPLPPPVQPVAEAVQAAPFAAPEPVIEAPPEPIFEPEPEPEPQPQPEIEAYREEIAPELPPIAEDVPPADVVSFSHPEPFQEPAPLFEAEPEPAFEAQPEPAYEPEPESAAAAAQEPSYTEIALSTPPPPAPEPEEPEPSYTQIAVAAASAAAAAATAAAAQAAAAAAENVGPADDLTRIRLIDTFVQERLNQIGVRMFDDIAAWMESDVARVSQTLGFYGRIEQENWIEQAQILATGGTFAASPDRAPEDIAAAVAVPVVADRLHRIIGIDPATEGILIANGVTRIADIAAWTWQDVERVEALIDKPGRVGLENWIEQAKFLIRAGDPLSSPPREHAPIGFASEPQSFAPVPEPEFEPESEVEAAEPELIAEPELQEPPVEDEPVALEPVDESEVEFEPELEPEAEPLAEESAEAYEGRSDNLAGLRSVRSEALRGDAGGASYVTGDIDDLKRIRGVGVLIEKKLNSLGITSYEQVANWTSADIARISQVLDFKGRIERENWVEQARILASGGQTEFSRRADRGEV